MFVANQQQAFALDARYNTQRITNNPNFRTLYIRRRSQLLRETQREPEVWRNYLKTRSTLLQKKYEHFNPESSLSSAGSSLKGSTSALHNEEISRALAGSTTISENYAFVGVHHIFDQHDKSVVMVKFANNDKSRLCCCSLDGNLSICDVTSHPPDVKIILKGHTEAVTGFDWSANNDLIVSVSVDATLKVWSGKDFDYRCIRTVKDPNNASLLCCLFHPINNNLLMTGNNKGDFKVTNVSLGRFVSGCKLGGKILCLTAASDGKIIWAGNNKGEIHSIFCGPDSRVCKMTKFSMEPTTQITSLSYRPWINRETRDPLLLVNATNNSLLIFSVLNVKGLLKLRRIFKNRQQGHGVRSSFCPIISSRQGSCVVSGSEDGNVYFFDIEKYGKKSILNTLQGHAITVLGISFNYDESLLATSDLQGLVIIWKKNKSL